MQNSKVHFLSNPGAHTDGKSWQSYFFSLLRSCDQNIRPSTLGPFFTPIIIHSIVVLPATYPSTPIQLTSSSLPSWQLFTHTVYSTMPWWHHPHTAPFGRGTFAVCCWQSSMISIFVSNKPIMNMNLLIKVRIVWRSEKDRWLMTNLDNYKPIFLFNR